MSTTLPTKKLPWRFHGGTLGLHDPKFIQKDLDDIKRRLDGKGPYRNPYTLTFEQLVCLTLYSEELRSKECLSGSTYIRDGNLELFKDAVDTIDALLKKCADSVSDANE